MAETDLVPIELRDAVGGTIERGGQAVQNRNMGMPHYETTQRQSPKQKYEQKSQTQVLLFIF